MTQNDITNGPTLGQKAKAPEGETRLTRTRPALQKALLALLEEKPFEDVTVRELTARARIGYRTFFRRYPDKDAVLHDLAAQEIATLLTLTLPILYTVDARASTQAVCAYVREHRKLWSALLTGGAAPILKQEFVRRAQQLAAERPATGSALPGDLSVVFSVSATVDILAWWLAQEEPPAIEKMAEILERLVVTPSLQGVTLHRP